MKVPADLPKTHLMPCPRGRPAPRVPWEWCSRSSCGHHARFPGRHSETLNGWECQWQPLCPARASMTHLVWVGAIPVRDNFCLAVTHQVHLEKEWGQEPSPGRQRPSPPTAQHRPRGLGELTLPFPQPRYLLGPA